MLYFTTLGPFLFFVLMFCLSWAQLKNMAFVPSKVTHCGFYLSQVAWWALWMAGVICVIIEAVSEYDDESDEPVPVTQNSIPKILLAFWFLALVGRSCVIAARHATCSPSWISISKRRYMNIEALSNSLATTSWIHITPARLHVEI